MDLPKNVGDMDRNIRYGVGALLAIAGVLNQNVILMGIGAIAIVTAFMGTCLAYKVLNINTKDGGKKSGDGK